MTAAHLVTTAAYLGISYRDNDGYTYERIHFFITY